MTVPWWWLTPNEREKLGLVGEVRRSQHGVVFGGPHGAKLEVLPVKFDGPAFVGPVRLRVWGAVEQRRSQAMLAVASRLLSQRVPRQGASFDPNEAPERELREAGGGAVSPTTVIDVPSTCERACTFCHVRERPSGQRVARGDLAATLRAIDDAPGAIVLTGDDALSNPTIVEIVEHAVRGRGGARPVTVIGPPRAGTTASLAPRLARAGLSRWVTGLFGPDAPTHDAVVGLNGAFAALEEATAALRAAGVEVELVSLLARPMLALLGAIVARGRAIVDRPITLLAYAPDPVVGDQFDDLVPSFDELRDALERIDGERVGLDALPLCVLSPRRRGGAPAALERSDAGLEAKYPAAPCDGCSVRGRCPGVAPTVVRATQGRGLRAL